MRTNIIELSLCFLLLTAGIAFGEVAKVSGIDKQVLVFADFEDNDVVKLWMDYDQPYTVNYKGLSEEYSFSGKKAFKLDVTFQDSGRFLWGLPVSVVCGEGTSVSAQMLLGAESTATACVGVSYGFSPTSRAGFTYMGKMYSGTNGKWVRTTLNDLERHAKTACDKVLHNYTGLLQREDIYPVLERVTIDIRAKRGDRFVIYLDDVTVEGQVSLQTASAHDRYNPAIARCAEVLGQLEKTIAQSKSAIGKIRWSYATLPLKREVEAYITQIEDEIAEVRAREIPIFDVWWLYKIRRKANRVSFAVANISSIEESETGSHLVYVISSPTDGAKWILPFDTLIPGKLDKAITMHAAKGEREPASFVVKAIDNLDQLEVQASDLVSVDGASRISSTNIDIKTVRCWYKGASSGESVWYSDGPRVLTPDLLLNDDSLIKIDHGKQDNFAKLQFQDKTEYRWISNPEVAFCPEVLVSDFPIRDSSVSLPAKLSANENRQFWVRVKVPHSVPHGEYTGKLKLISSGVVIDEISLTVAVLAFDLLPAYYTPSIDYHGTLVAEDEATIASHKKSKTQMLAELKNMVDHGLSNCQHYFAVTDKSLRNVLELRAQAGMDNRSLYLKGHGMYLLHWKKEKLEEIEDRVRHIIKVAQEYGVEEVFFYGRDEETGSMLKAQRNSWKAVRNAGGKIYVAGGRDNLPLMGDIQDMNVLSGWPDFEEVRGWHGHGHKIFAYNNPQTGVENPDIYRRNFGLIMWKYGYDGIANNAYQHTFGLIWNDFDDKGYRNHSMTYPTTDGVVDTVSWEGYREGIDDVRYITTLEAMIGKAKDLGGDDAVVADAEAFVNNLRTSQAIESENLDDLRNRIVRHITKLSSN